MKLVPLHVLIGLEDNGMHKFPAFNDIPNVIRGNSDWSHFVDRFGSWHYDSQCGHADHDPENGTPVGMWCGMVLVPKNFADAAVEKFPDECSVMSEADAEKFYDERAHAHQPEINDSTDVLQAIAAKRALGIDDSDEDVNALDPDHPAAGRRRNKTKTWKGFKKQRGIELE
jgi:hypothetical protein